MIVVISSHPWEFRLSHVVTFLQCTWKLQLPPLRTWIMSPAMRWFSMLRWVPVNVAQRGRPPNLRERNEKRPVSWRDSMTLLIESNLDTLPKNDLARANTDTQDSKGWQSFVARTTWSNRATWYAWSCSRSRYLVMFHTEGQTKCTVKTASPAWLPTGVPGLAWEDEWEGYSKGKTGIALQKDMTSCRVVHLYIDHADSFLQFAWDLCW